MKIKEIRDFKQLSLEEQKTKLRKTKVWLKLLILLNSLSAFCTLTGGVELYNLYKGYSTSHDSASYIFHFLLLFAVISGGTIDCYKDIVQQDTIIKLEEDELTRERTL